MKKKTRGWVLAPLVAASTLVGTAPARANTECVVGGPTPGYQALRLDLPSGSSFLTLELSGARTSRPVYQESNWHLAQGIIVVNADSVAAGTPEIEAYRVASMGMSPRRVVARTDGSSVVDEAVPAAEVPYVHEAARLRDGLPAGSYLIFAFGLDGGAAMPNEWWTASVQVEGSYQCSWFGEGETFDYDHTDFSGGTQVYLPGAGHASDISLEFTTPRDVAFGLMDAQTQGRVAGSDAELSFAMPSASGAFSQQLMPFLSLGGEFSFRARYSGWSPLVLVAGASLDMS